MIVKPKESGDGDGVPANKYLNLACGERIFWQWVSSINWKIVANAQVKSRI